MTVETPTEIPAGEPQKATQTPTKRPTAADKITARRLYVQGGGTAKDIANKLNLSVDTVRDWVDDYGWVSLRDDYDRRELQKLLPPIEPPPPPLPTFTATDPRNNQRLLRLEKKLAEMEDQMDGMTDTKALKDLTMAHGTLFDAYCTLAGIQRPGTRKPQKTRRGTSEVSPSPAPDQDGEPDSSPNQPVP